MQIEQLKPIVEAALLAASQPLSVVQLCELFAEEDEVGRDDVARALEALAADCEGRGVELKEVASGFRYQVRQAVHPWVSRMWTEKPSRYSRALLETLALIAYRQPITRPEIEQIRGVVVSSNIIKTLEERGWIRVVGHRDVPGRPALFGTTRAFLDYFNLKSLDELPPLSEIREMEDPQLRLDEEPLPARVARDLPIDPDGDAADDAGAAATDDAAAATEAADAAAGTAQAGAGNDDGEAPSASEIEPDAAALAAAVDELAEANADPSAADPAAHDTDAAPAPEAGAEPDHPTADEAATPADADPGAAEQDTEEYRA